MLEETRTPWDRRSGESARAFAFRSYRNLGPARSLTNLAESTTISTAARSWSNRWDWSARAVAWDDHVARVEDEERLEAIRLMHRNHQRAGRAVQQFALQALAVLDPEDASPSDVARLLDLGVRLERETLSTSVEELQGRVRLPVADDPWSRIVDELSDIPRWT